jgi:hypothetical protein
VLSLITSGAFIGPELAAEFGPIPPSFLPIGHDRLYQYQALALAALGDRIVLTLPEAFAIPEWDARRLGEAKVEIMLIPPNLSLGESIARALSTAGDLGAIRILHGDTLFMDPLPPELDVVLTDDTRTAYAWGEVSSDGQFRNLEAGQMHGRSEHVLSGFFAFSNGNAFLRALILAEGVFVSAINIYAKNRPIRCAPSPNWLDFGHLQTFYQSRGKFSTARAFNRLSISDGKVRKDSDKSLKITHEADWFSKLPASLRHQIPVFLGRNDDLSYGPSYCLEYELSPTLHELYLFGRLPIPVWTTICERLFKFLEQLSSFKASEPSFPVLPILVIEKSERRLKEFASVTGIRLDAEWILNGRRLPSLASMLQEIMALIKANKRCDAVMHGDFCFPNIFFDFRYSKIKVIDPRGSVDDKTATIYGDSRYDLAKLSHSLEGYDLILASRYELNQQEYVVDFRLAQDDLQDAIRQTALCFNVNGLSLGDPEIKALTILLFLSMLPLHSDRSDRQSAFLANALRLYDALMHG